MPIFTAVDTLSPVKTHNLIPAPRRDPKAKHAINSGMLRQQTQSGRDTILKLVLNGTGADDR